MRPRHRDGVKLTSVDIADNNAPEHLLCLTHTELLMLFSLSQAALMHSPMRECLMSKLDYRSFHGQLTRSLAAALSLEKA